MVLLGDMTGLTSSPETIEAIKAGDLSVLAQVLLSRVGLKGAAKKIGKGAAGKVVAKEAEDAAKNIGKGAGKSTINLPEFKIADRVYDQLKDPRMGKLSGQLTEVDLQKLVNNKNAMRVIDKSSGHINIIQEINGKLIRITVPRDEMKIISVGPIRNNQVNNSIKNGRFIPIE